MPRKNSSPYLDSLAVDYLDSLGRLGPISDTAFEAMISPSIGINMAVVLRR
jgi:hypothetical protein